MSGPIHRLTLGPIVGHTDHQSTRIWIRVRDDVSRYVLRVQKRGLFNFESTEVGEPEFGTAVAVADGLRPDWEYQYQVLRKGRVIPNGRGTFRTMPPPGSFADVLFVTISCSDSDREGAWKQLGDYIKQAKPRFLLMIGDQVYLDQEDSKGGPVWPGHLYSPARRRRQAMARKYEHHWSHDFIRTIMANIPTYMMWDDHEIHDGWGSWAFDSPTLAAEYPSGAEFAAACDAYFEDARDLYYHFQMSHNPPPPDALPLPPYGVRQGLPFVFRCGRLAVLVLDDRGDRDIWRANNPVLGDRQWEFIEQTLGNLPADVDALAVVTPVPLTLMSPQSAGQLLLGDRADDVNLFKNGNAAALLELQHAGEKSFLNVPGALAHLIVADATQKVGARFNLHWGDLKIGDLDDIRDQWSHRASRPEQLRLLRAAALARLTNRVPSDPRGLVFLGGDFHAGGLFQLTFSDPEFTAQTLISSGISKDVGGATEKGGSGPDEPVGFTFDEDFEVAPGIRAVLQDYVPVFNFGITHITFNGSTPRIVNSVAHKGNAGHWTIRAGTFP
ncbi:MAG TPA: alkaline phosphatase D family protein [Pyrinomonadaceae bacterium]|jgi:hypothetical protein